MTLLSLLPFPPLVLALTLALTLALVVVDGGARGASGKGRVLALALEPLGDHRSAGSGREGERSIDQTQRQAGVRISVQ